MSEWFCAGNRRGLPFPSWPYFRQSQFAVYEFLPRTNAHHPARRDHPSSERGSAGERAITSDRGAPVLVKIEDLEELLPSER